MLTEYQFNTLFPHSKIKLESLNSILKEHNIYTINRYASFIAQCAHESAGFSRLSENLNYSRTALLSVFKKYFNESNVDDFARKPEKIANVVYANRMGNTNPNDGWTYRGRGIIQITGKNNYSKLASFLNKDILSNPNILLESDDAVMSAVWYWKENGLDCFADIEDIKGMTRKINGGYNGLKDRIEKYKKIKHMIENGDTGREFDILKIGSVGEDVAFLQTRLSIHVDGHFGKKTEEAVKKFQLENGLYVDGIVGKKTFKLLC